MCKTYQLFDAAKGLITVEPPELREPNFGA